MPAAATRTRRRAGRARPRGDRRGCRRARRPRSRRRAGGTRGRSPAGPCRARSAGRASVSRNEPKSTADAASMRTKPPPTARSASRSMRSSGRRVRSSSSANAASPRARDAEAERLDDVQPAVAPARSRRRSRRGWRWRAARREVEAAPPRPLASAGTIFSAATASDDADGQVDEEDRAPVDELGQRAAEQDADRRAGAADRTPGAERLRPLARPGRRT